MEKDYKLKVFGIASGMAAEVYGAELGVWDLFYNNNTKLHFQKVLYPSANLGKLKAIPTLASLYKELHESLAEVYSLENKYLFLTGDHANGFGVWSGLLKVYQQDIGLIWVDAHLDSHTPESSPTKNVHGMPIAHLLGYGSPLFTNLLSKKLKPENLAFIGTRSYEDDEINLLNKLGVKIFFMKDITNVNHVFQEAVSHVTKNTNYFGISLDIDSMDPVEMPATGCYNPNGLLLQDVVNNIKICSANKKFLALELTEFNPLRDNNRKTFKGICHILNAYLSNFS
ncbi:Arginase [Candidatus Hepatincola sp. Av]